MEYLKNWNFDEKSISFSLHGRIEAGSDSELLEVIKKWETHTTVRQVVVDMQSCEILNLRAILGLARWADRLRENGA